MYDELSHPYILLSIWPFQVIRLCPRDEGGGGCVVQAGTCRSQAGLGPLQAAHGHVMILPSALQNSAATDTNVNNNLLHEL